ncbi:MAG: hypothetical protein GKS06_12460 [Acidobacteria bacterium]|nr:hypothetical protein [Acidobacteriota bacterium]
MSNEMIALLVGTAAGLHTSTWGMYKDAPHEGFAWPKYFRSTIVGAFAGVALQYFMQFDLSLASNIAVFFGGCYVLERALTEGWKTFIRVEDQSKYFIPMQFSVFGNVVESRATQLAVGAGYAVVVLVIGYVLAWAQQTVELPGLLVVVTIGAVGGWLSAFGGAWKDAPKEGFQTFKFFRSPGMAAAFAYVMAHFTDNWIVLAGTALGYTIATTETYKTFFFLSRPRGKFQGMPVLHPEWETRRFFFVPVYVAIWIGVIASIVLGFMGPRSGLL